MNVTDEKWNDIVNETRAGIDRWNARAAERGLKDTFRVSTATPDKFVAIITEHDGGGDFEAKALARETATGEVRPVKLIIKKGRIVGFKPRPDPKAWKLMATSQHVPSSTRLGCWTFL